MRRGRGERCGLRPRVAEVLLLLAAAVGLASGDGSDEPISLADFKARMLQTYPSAQDAFAALDATASNLDAALDDRPLDVNEFVRGVQTFQPPVTEAQARYVFQALDADGDGRLVSREFVDGLDAESFAAAGAAGSSSTTAPSTSSDHFDLGELESRVEDQLSEPTIVRSHPGQAFRVLDPNDDGVSELAEFTAATAGLAQPLTEAQASSAFSQLDANNDGRVQAHEYYRAEGLQATATATHTGPITFDGYKQRVEGLPHRVGVLLQVAAVDPDHLTETARNDIIRLLVLGIADAAGVQTASVKDLSGTAASVSISAVAPHAETGRLRRRLGGQNSLAVEAIIELPEGRNANVDDIVAVLGTRDRRTRFADDLASVPGIHNAVVSNLDADTIHVSALGASGPGSGALLAMDADRDGSVDSNEFRAAAAHLLRPPLTQTQADQAFVGLDADFDARLSAAELVGQGMSGFVDPTNQHLTTIHGTTAAPSSATTSTRHEVITMEEFKSRLLQAYSSPQKAFEAFGANPADADAFSRVARALQPPLTDEQVDYAFRGMDADNDNLLFNTEFFDVLRFGHFNPTIAQLEAVAAGAKRPAAAPVAAPPGTPSGGILALPLPVGLAYLLLVGYLLRTVCLGLRLPGFLGIVLSGATFVLFMPVEFAQAIEVLHDLAFFLVLFTAGFELSLADVRPFALVMALLPASLELAAIALYGHCVLGYSGVEALAMGTTLFAVGGGVVVPKMSEFGKRFAGHPMPRLVSMSASVETAFALALFGVLIGFTSPTNQGGTDSARLQIIANAVRLTVTVCGGALLGYGSGKLIPQRRRVQLLGRSVFTGAPVEAFLILLAVALAAFGTGASGADGGALVHMGLSAQALFQPELLVMAVGAFFTASSDAHEIEDVERSLGSVWIFGQLLLFSLLGCTSWSPGNWQMFGQVHHMVLMMVLGLALRFAGIFVGMCLTLRARTCSCTHCYQANSGTLFFDCFFCFLATLPRSTVQGCLGTTHMLSKLFMGMPGSMPVQIFVADAARLYVFVLSSVGSLVLDAIGPTLLQSSASRSSGCEVSTRKERQFYAEGWTSRQRALSAGNTNAQPHKFFKLGLVSEDGVLFEDAHCPAFPVKEAVQTLAEAYHVDPSVFSDLLQKTSGKAPMVETQDGNGWVTHPANASYSSVRQMGQYSNTAEEMATQKSGLLSEQSMTTRSRTRVRRVSNVVGAPPLGQLEADGATSVEPDKKEKTGGLGLSSLVRL